MQGCYEWVPSVCPGSEQNKFQFTSLILDVQEESELINKETENFINHLGTGSLSPTLSI